MTTKSLVLKRGSISRSSGQWHDDDYDVLENGVVGGISKEQVAPKDRPWMWSSGHNGEIRRAARGYEAMREAAGREPLKSQRHSPYAYRRRSLINFSNPTMNANFFRCLSVSNAKTARRPSIHS
jgi:hypothetical protein